MGLLGIGQMLTSPASLPKTRRAGGRGGLGGEAEDKRSNEEGRRVS